MNVKPNTLVLGIGSPFGDDQFGWLVAKKIQAKLIKLQQDNIKIEIADRPGLNLLRFLEMNYQKIILVDLVNAQVEPGHTFDLKAKEILQFSGFLSSHNIGVGPSMALADALNLPIDHVHFYGVQGQRFYVKDMQLSSVVKLAVADTASFLLEGF